MTSETARESVVSYLRHVVQLLYRIAYDCIAVDTEKALKIRELTVELERILDTL